MLGRSVASNIINVGPVGGPEKTWNTRENLAQLIWLDPLDLTLTTPLNFHPLIVYNSVSLW